MSQEHSVAKLRQIEIPSAEGCLLSLCVLRVEMARKTPGQREGVMDGWRCCGDEGGQWTPLR
jgi:hypothetical protein